MGQYYIGCFLNSKKRNYANRKKGEAFMHPNRFGNGMKLMEFSWIGNEFMNYFESLIEKENGKYAYYPIVFAGDYAEPEPKTLNNKEVNLYDLGQMFGKSITTVYFDDYDIAPKHYRYLINEDSMEYVDTKKMKKCGYKKKWQIHPLSILCSEGCGQGGGDYFGESDLIGKWARQIVVTSNKKPSKDYKEIVCDFEELW